MSLDMGGAEWDALAIRWATGRVPEDEQASLHEQMSRAERRQFAKRLEAVEEKRLHTADSFVTKRQMVGYMGMLIETKMMPLAHNLDDLTAVVQYLSMPFYKRWWVQAVKVWLKFNDWLAKKGIRLVRLEEDDGLPASGGELDARRSEGSAVPGGAEEVRGEAESDRLHPSDPPRVEHPGSAADGSGRIRVVSR